MKTINKVRIIATPFVVVAILLAITILIIFYGRGYRLDFGQKAVEVKGLLVASSQPNGAQVFINGKLTTATNTTLTLNPDWYTVRIEKEGYSAWEKKLRVQGEVVAKTDAILFPINPSLSPLTITGISNPQLSPDNTKIVFSVSKNNTKLQDAFDGAGVYLLDLSDKPLGATRNTRQIAQNTTLLSFDNAQFFWDPESKKVLTKINNRYFLLDSSSLNSTPMEVTTMLKAVYEEWQSAEKTLHQERLESLKPDLVQFINSATSILSWSFDETKILYEATASATLPQIIKPPLIGTNPTEEQRQVTPNKLYVYDMKEDKNFFIMDKKEISPPSPTPAKSSKTPAKDIVENLTISPLIWFPTSSHLLLTEEGKISVMDYDAINKVTLYAGPFVSGLVAPWPNGSKIVILTTLNPQPDAQPNLYAINIR